MKTLINLCKFGWYHQDILWFKVREKLQRFRNMQDYKKSNGRSGPTLISFRVTKNCNCRCSMCALFGEKGTLLNETNIEQLSYNDVVAVVNDIRAYRPRITMTGDGEPFLHSDLFKMVKYIKTNKMLCQVFTNGSLLRNRINEIFESKVDIITVSVDGPEEIHDSIRALPGLFQKIVEGVKTIQERKRQEKKHKPIIAISFTITPANYTRISEMADFVNELGIEIMNINHLCMPKQKEIDATKKMLGVPASTSWPASEGFLVEHEEIDSKIVVKGIRELCSKSNAFIHQSPPLSDDEIISYYSKKQFQLREQCYSPWFRIRVKPNGDVLPCVEFFLGNIRKESFNNIWKGEKMQYFRSIIKKYGKFPSCDRKCCDRHFKPVRKSNLYGKQKSRVRGI